VTLKTCLDCGELGDGTRCSTCQARHKPGAQARGYTRQWQSKAATIKRQQPSCAVCGSTLDLTVDHIVPKVVGGTDELTNLQTLCRRCNGAKGGRR
jgi:5-methylcytosine-specific restriction endonuclease McrA